MDSALCAPSPEAFYHPRHTKRDKLWTLYGAPAGTIPVMKEEFETSASVSITARDVLLLRGLFESRVMTPRHIADLFFGGRREATKKRLQKLTARGVLARRRESRFESSLISLSGKGIRFLSVNGHLSGFPRLSPTVLERRCSVSEFTLRHELAVLDFKVSLCRSAKNLRDTDVLEFGTWPRLYEFDAPYHGTTVTVRPDGFLRLEHSIQAEYSLAHSFFVELDRSTESLGVLVERIAAYQSHYRSGGFAASRGGGREQFREYPFRVLIILKSVERLVHLVEELLAHQPPILTLVLLSTIEEAGEDPFGTVWIRPLDCREFFATRGTSKAVKNMGKCHHVNGNERQLGEEAPRVSILQ